MEKKGIVMLSGGLDSVSATHLLMSQGIDLLALHFVLPFVSGLGLEHKKIRYYADALGVKLRIIEEGEEYIQMIKDPRYGFGKNANPCVDCRIHRLQKAKKIMEQEGASFIATGEVIGQRPMSQRVDIMSVIEKRAGLEGYLLRPLCAKLLPPTMAEKTGIVDREKLMEISGRSRKAQLEYAGKNGLKHTAPAGGCALTNIGTANRFMELVNHDPGFDLEDFKLLAYGRHFRLSKTTKLIVCRNDHENQIFEKLASKEDYLMDVVGHSGPYGLLRGNDAMMFIELSGGIVAHYSKAKDLPTTEIRVLHNEEYSTMQTTPVTDSLCASMRIGERGFEVKSE